MSGGGDRARIRRGGGAGDRARRPVATVRRPTPKKRTSAASRALATLPVPGARLRQAGNWALALLLVAAFAGGLIAMRVPQMIGVGVGEAIGAMGFTVRNIEIVGRKDADASRVYEIAIEQKSRAMPLVDLDGTRARLMDIGWIADARVSRRLPDTLVVDIVERKPVAIWQHRQHLALIDKDGTVIAPVIDSKMPDLPLVIGPGANRAVGDLETLIATAPGLKPLVVGATWIGDRRWDLRFQSGETLALPEGQAAARRALVWFAKQDATVRLLGQGFVRFDLRDPARMVVRVSKEPGRRVADPDTTKSI